MNKIKMNWPCLVYATVRLPNGQKRTISKTVEGLGDVEKAMFQALSSRRDCGVPFYGAIITAITPLRQRVRRIFHHDGMEPHGI